MKILEVEKPNLRLMFRKTENSGNDFLDQIDLVGSGKGAMAVVLGYLRSKGQISSRNDEVLVSDWLGYWVYNQIQPYAFAAKRFSERTKVLMVYHQYGFPQDMDKIMEFAADKKLVVIEDCAHAINSFYKGRQCGGFGDFSIFSFSKWLFCFALGGVNSDSEDFKRYLAAETKSKSYFLTLYKDLSKYLSEKSLFSESKNFKRFANLLLNSSYGLYGEALKPSGFAKNLMLNKVKNEIAVRQKRYLEFLKATEDLGICDHLERTGITPYVIPIICPENKTDAVLAGLRGLGVVSGLYHFDVSRNLLAPKFEKVIWIPCHAAISDNSFADITDLIVSRIK